MSYRAKKVICWWSGGVTSAVACKIAIDLYGTENCRVIMMDTMNEDPDTYRFLKICQEWYGVKIERISCLQPAVSDPDITYVDIGHSYNTIQDIWIQNESLNVAHGAICSTELKRRVREVFQKTVEYDHQVFGFEFDKKEMNRALAITKNHPKAKGIFPLLMLAYDKKDCIRIVQEAGIRLPNAYTTGLSNNNCVQTGCVQGGVGYWQKIQRDYPEKFEAMADMEHRLTGLRGEPVTMLKDQSLDAKSVVEETGIKWKSLVFLRKHPDYPELKCLADMKPQEVKPLVDCNGFCGTNDLNGRVSTDTEINFESN